MKNIKKTPDAQPLNDWNLHLILVYSPGYRIPLTACICTGYDLTDDGTLIMYHEDTATRVEDYSWYQVFDGTNEEFTELSANIEKFVTQLGKNNETV